MNEQLSELLAAAQERDVTIRGEDGEPVYRVKLLHALLAAVAAVIMAPRLAAAAAFAALFKGYSLTVEDTGDEPAAA